MLLDSKVAVVTGGGRGIGRAVARAFTREGARVVVADLDGHSAGRVADELAAAGHAAFGVEIDVTDEAAVDGMFDVAVERFGHLDCLVANAGVLRLRAVVDLPLEEWRDVLEVNLTGIFLCAKHAARRMIRRGDGGRILMTSSLNGVRGQIDNGAYAASKFAVLGLMQCLAAEMAPHAVLVNAICPGQVDTAMNRLGVAHRAEQSGRTHEAIRQWFTSGIPLGHLASPEEIAEAYVFLASQMGRYVTGQALVIDGGWMVS
jgi:NAD(P)-dependent dehydrogenase (short-subunit alcohol dehydrogenase family)